MSRNITHYFGKISLNIPTAISKTKARFSARSTEPDILTEDAILAGEMNSLAKVSGGKKSYIWVALESQE